MLTLSLCMTCGGFIVGMASYFRFTEADERDLQAVSFALVSVGTTLGFSSELWGTSSAYIVLVCLILTVGAVGLFARHRRPPIPVKQQCKHQESKAGGKKEPDAPRGRAHT
jgi:hypothetical protein